MQPVLEATAEIGIEGLVVGLGEAAEVIGAGGVLHVVLIVVPAHTAVLVPAPGLRDHLSAKIITISSI